MKAKAVVGRERMSEMANSNQVMIDHSTTSRERNIFVITRIWNSYDPKTGALETPNEFEPYSHFADRNDRMFTIPLGKIDVEHQDKIYIPTFSIGGNLSRLSRHRSGDLSRVVLENEKDREDGIDFEDLRPFIYEDSVKNVFILVEQLPDEIKNWMQGKKVVLVVEYKETYLIPSPLVSELIGRMSEQESQALNDLLPEKVVRELEKIHKKKWHSRHILNYLAQSLGSIWLTYSRLDSPQGRFWLCLPRTLILKMKKNKMELFMAIKDF
jgi:hypothetical protein